MGKVSYADHRPIEGAHEVRCSYYPVDAPPTVTIDPLYVDALLDLEKLWGGEPVMTWNRGVVFYVACRLGEAKCSG